MITETDHSPTTAQRSVERRRRLHWIAGLVIASAAVAALVLALIAAGQLGNSAARPPSGATAPRSAQGLLSLASDPLLAKEEGTTVRPGATPIPLSACISSPLSWGAAESDAATYGRPGQPRFGNEFVLRFNSVAAAHNAVTEAWRMFHDCPTPRTVETGSWGLPVPGGGWHLSEYFANQRARFATLGDTRRNNAQPVATYSLRVARRQNVVVVVETTDPDDRAEFILSLAMSKATADGQRERLILSAVGGRGGW